jgi:hypothetical protein
MAKGYSTDLRSRVVVLVEAGDGAARSHACFAGRRAPISGVVLGVAGNILLPDLAEVAGAARAQLTQEPADEPQVADDGPRRQTAFPWRIVAELLEYLVLWDDRRQCCRHDRARAAQHRQQPLQRRSVAWLHELLRCLVSEIPLDDAFIEIGQLRAACCDPTQEIADQAEATPSTLASEPVSDETSRVYFYEMSVGSILQALEQPAPAQVMFYIHHPEPPLLKAETQDKPCRADHISVRTIPGEKSPFGIVRRAA